MHGMKSQMELADEEFETNLAKEIATDTNEKDGRNPSAMREALEGIAENLSTRIELRRGNRVTMPVGEAKCLVGYARAALAATPEPPSYDAKMREALESCLNFIVRIDRAFNPFMQNLLENAVAKAEAALEEVRAAKKAYKEICEGD